MKTFHCTCSGNPSLFFESTSCTACGRTTGITNDFDQVQAFDLDEKSGFYYLSGQANVQYKQCQNFAQYHACNGMIELNDNKEASDLCFACLFNDTIPNLEIEEHLPLWRKMETAKRRTLFSINALPIPLNNLQQAPDTGLSFDFTVDRDVKDHFSSELPNHSAVMTGHDCGHITINLAEADEVARSKAKMDMGERYRTLLGHFRHEIGHYYFDQLISKNPKQHALCKEVFGDDELDYQEALDRHYSQGAPSDWPQRYISEYATMHPWEDWAETWAHYLHIIDTLQTAQENGLALILKKSKLTETSVADLELPQSNDYFTFQTPFADILSLWMRFSVIFNSLNRSMGLQDAYPFVLSPEVRKKLTFIHYAVHNQLNHFSI